MDAAVEVDFNECTKRHVVVSKGKMTIQRSFSNGENSKTGKICQTFKRHGTCRYGEGCKYVHDFIAVQEDQNEKPTVESQGQDYQDENNVSSAQNLRNCQYFLSQRGCRYGDNCHMKHYRSINDAGKDTPNDENYFIELDKKDALEMNSVNEEGLENQVVAQSGSPSESTARENKFSKKNIDSSEAKQKTLCRYFKTSRGCSKKKCSFLHSLSTSLSNLNKEVQTNGKIPDNINYASETNVQKVVENERSVNRPQRIHSKSEKLCKFHTSENSCVKKSCPYRHEQPVKEDEYRAGKVCEYYLTGNGCFAKNCTLLHPNDLQFNSSKRDSSLIYIKNTQASNQESRKSTKNMLSADKTEATNEKAIVKSKNDNNKKTKADIKCRFFWTSTGCDNRKCPYLHEQSLNSTLNSTGLQNNDTVIPQTICKYFTTAKGCYKGSECPNKHVTEEKKESGERLREIEFTQLEKRFKACESFQLVQDEPRIYVIAITPTDPDWVFNVKQFKLRLEFPEDYPSKMFKVDLIEEVFFPPGFHGFFNNPLHAWVNERQRNKQDLAFRPFLKWFDKNLNDIFLKAAAMVKGQRDASQSGIQLIPHKNILQNSQTNVSNENKTEKVPKEDGHQSEAVELSVTDANDLMATHGGAPADDKSRMVSERVKKGVEIKFANLVMSENIGTLKLQKIVLTVECSRCKSRTDFKLQEKSPAREACKKCSTDQSVVFYPELIHQFSPVVGYLHMQGCHAFDLVLQDSVLILNCLKCSKDSVFNGLGYGSARAHWCHRCHEKMELQIQITKFHQARDQQSTGNTSTKEKDDSVKKRPVKDPSIKDGEPLPYDGTCKHYKKSYRWLRFPCCGKVYPCDTCHEEGEENDHEMKFATRMICGHCSKEQPFTNDKPCVRCNGNVTRSKSSHWEGGKGCRDSTKMARSDNKKMAGMNKTVSRKKANEKEKK